MRRLAVLSLHTSPLAQPGTGDGGGMNVYVRELTSALARSDVACDVFTRAWSPDLPPVLDVEPGLRVHHVPAGPLDVLPKESLPAVVDEFTAAADAVLASCTVEADQIASLYGGDPGRIRIVPPGVDHAFFGPGHRPQARRALGLPVDGRLLLFVGRTQPLKGADVAVEPLAELRQGSGEQARLVVVGGPSGPHGEKSLQRLHDVADARGGGDHVHFVDPQPHE